MAKITITKRNGDRIEISDHTDFAFDELKELLGMNGHAAVQSSLPRSAQRPVLPGGEPDYEQLKLNLTEKAIHFLSILRQHPNGIQADELAEKLHFKTSNQIGGMTGGGMGKLAARYGVKLENVYARETTFENGMRRTIYKPGKDIGLLL